MNFIKRRLLKLPFIEGDDQENLEAIAYDIKSLENIIAHLEHEYDSVIKKEKKSKSYNKALFYFETAIKINNIKFYERKNLQNLIDNLRNVGILYCENCHKYHNIKDLTPVMKKVEKLELDRQNWELELNIAYYCNKCENQIYRQSPK